MIAIFTISTNGTNSIPAFSALLVPARQILTTKIQSFDYHGTRTIPQQNTVTVKPF